MISPPQAHTFTASARSLHAVTYLTAADEERGMASRDEQEGESTSNDVTKENGGCPYTKQKLQRLLADAITYKCPIRDIETILRSGGEVNRRVSKGLRLLHYASYVNYIGCVHYLLDHGADVNLADDIGHTPLHICARQGFVDIMQILISNGANIDFSSGDDDTLSDDWTEPLNMAIESNSTECVRLLLESGARPNNKYFLGYEINLAPLDNVDCLKLLLRFGADPNSFSRNGMNTLMKACRERKLETARILIEHGADVNLRCPPRFEQKTALHFAIQSKSVAIVHSLLRQGASTLKPDGYIYAALHEAVLQDKADMCKLLLKWRAHVDEQTTDNITPLMLACSTKHLTQRKDIIKVLLEYGADVNAHSEHTTYEESSLSPLVNYLKNIGEYADFDIVHVLVTYGARLTFQCDVIGYSVKDPFGILNYVPLLCHRCDVMGLLIEAAEKFHLPAIKRNPDIAYCYKKLLINLGGLPRNLRHLIRLKIRRMYKTNLPETIERFPLPDILKKYFLFAVPFESAWYFKPCQ